MKVSRRSQCAGSQLVAPPAEPLPLLPCGRESRQGGRAAGARADPPPDVAESRYPRSGSGRSGARPTSHGNATSLHDACCGSGSPR